MSSPNRRHGQPTSSARTFPSCISVEQELALTCTGTQIVGAKKRLKMIGLLTG